MKAQGVAWILTGSLFMFGCGSDAGGPGSSATSSAEIGACTGEGCPGECRQVSIKTAFGKSVALCDETETANDGNGSSTKDAPPIVNVGVEPAPDAGVDNPHVTDDHDAGPAIDHTAHDDAGAGHEADAGIVHEADAGAGHEADAGGDQKVDAGAGHEADAGTGHEADASHEVGDAGPAHEGDAEGPGTGGADAGATDGGCGVP